MDKTFDFSQAKPVSEVSALKNLQQAYQNSQKATHQAFDDDVIAWVEQQSPTTQHHINEMIRHFMAINHSVANG